MNAKAAQVITGQGVQELRGKDGKLVAAVLQDGREIPCHLAVLAVGVRPNSELAGAAGLVIGNLGGILVNDYMQTTAPDIYARPGPLQARPTSWPRPRPGPPAGWRSQTRTNDHSRPRSSTASKGFPPMPNMPIN